MKSITNPVMQDCVINTPMVTRVEVIDKNGRSYVNKDDKNHVCVMIQDEGRTLKVCIN